MPDLRLIGVHEDGQHLILAGPDGEHHTLAVDDALRTAARRDRPRMGQLQIEIDGGLRPREVQSLIRAGGSTEDVADRAGWSVDKVRRYEGPILAERAHVADQARLVRVRHRGGATTGSAPTLQGRVAQRMRERGVDPETSTSWDAARAPEATTWTVILTFAAGGRQRHAVWTYNPVLRSVEAADDEARWLSADDVVVAGPLPAASPRVANVYDVEAEGGVAATTRRAAAAARSADRAGEASEEPVDLMTAMRQRTTVGRRSGRRRVEPPRAETTPALPLEGSAADEVDPSEGAAHEQPELPAAPADAAPADAEPTNAAEGIEPAGAEIPPLDEDVDPPSEPATPGHHDADDADADAGDDAGAADADADSPAADDDDAGALAGPDDESDVEPPTSATSAAEPAADAAPRSSKRRPRTSVPSWDDIMFGAKRD